MPRIRSQELNGLFPLSYMGVIPVSPSNLIIEQFPPTSDDANNVYIGDIWLDTGTDNPPKITDVYLLAALKNGVATWLPFAGGLGNIVKLTGNDGIHVPPLAGNINIIGSGAVNVTGNAGTHTLTISLSGAGILETLTGNSGGAVSPLAGNINVVGDGTIVDIVGNPGTSTLTASLTGIVATTYDGNSGSATPLLGVLNILGDTTTATTSAGGNTVTISSITSPTVATTYDCDTGSATPSSNVLNILGGSGISTSGAGNTVTINYTATPLLSAFRIDQGVAQPNATGDGTVVTVICSSVTYNDNSDYNTVTGIYTAPVDGIYMFVGNVPFTNVQAGNNNAGVGIAVNGTALFYTGPGNIANIRDAAHVAVTMADIIIKLNASQQVTLVAYANGSTKVVGIGGVTGGASWMGALIQQTP